MAQDFDTAVRLHLYRRFLAEGRPPTPTEAARDMGVEPEEVEAAYRRLHEGRAIVLHPGSAEVWMANPLSAVPTPFRVTVGGRHHWGNCAWDALGVIAMLGGDGRLETVCGDCGEPMRVELSGGELRPMQALFHVAGARLERATDSGTCW